MNNKTLISNPAFLDNVCFVHLIFVGLGDHLFDLLVREPLAEVHHAVLELSLADETVAVSIKYSETKRFVLPYVTGFLKTRRTEQHRNKHLNLDERVIG